MSKEKLKKTLLFMAATGLIIIATVSAGEPVQWTDIVNHSLDNYFYILEGDINKTLHMNETTLNATIQAHTSNYWPLTGGVNISGNYTFDQNNFNLLERQGYGGIWFEDYGNARIGGVTVGQNDKLFIVENAGSDFFYVTGGGNAYVGNPASKLVDADDSVTWTGSHLYIEPIKYYKQDAHPDVTDNRTALYSYYDTNLNQTWFYFRSSNGDIVRVEGTVQNASSGVGSATLNNREEDITNKWNFQSGISTTSAETTNGYGKLNFLEDTTSSTNTGYLEFDAGEWYADKTLFTITGCYYYGGTYCDSDYDPARFYAANDYGDSYTVGLEVGEITFTGYGKKKVTDGADSLDFVGNKLYFAGNGKVEAGSKLTLKGGSSTMLSVVDSSNNEIFRVDSTQVVINKDLVSYGGELNLGKTTGGQEVNNIIMKGVIKGGELGQDSTLNFSNSNVTLQKGNLKINNDLYVNNTKTLGGCSAIETTMQYERGSISSGGYLAMGNGQSPYGGALFCDGTVDYFSFMCSGSMGTSLDAYVIKNNVATSCALNASTTKGQGVVVTCDVDVSAGDVVGVKTGTEVGSWTVCTALVHVKYK